MLGLFCSLVAIVNHFVHIRLKWWAPWVGIVAQLPWFVLAYVTGQWGLVLAALWFLVMETLSIRKWARLRELAGR